MRRVLVGGTFDPPHLAHLVAGEVAYRQLGADTVTYIPAGAPWQKADRRVSNGEHRLEMIRRATEGVDYFQADEREVVRDGWTYTIDTLESFDTTDELIFVMGADAAADLTSWHRYGDILDRATVAVLPRRGTEIRQVEDAIGVVVWLDTPLLDISGTDIRARMSTGRSIRFLVTDPVWRYIAEHDLYRPETRGGSSGSVESHAGSQPGQPGLIEGEPG